MCWKAELPTAPGLLLNVSQDLGAWWEAKCCLLYVINILAASLLDVISGLRGEKSCGSKSSKSEMMHYKVHSYGGLCFSNHSPAPPGIQTPTRTPVIDVQMDVVPKVSPNLGQTSVQGRDQWLP